MNEVEYMIEKLQKKLLFDHIEIDDDNLLYVTRVYDNLYAFLEEQHLTNIAKYRYQFLYSNNPNKDDETNYDIIKSLIELNSFKGYYLLDYPTILHKLSGGMYHFNNLLNSTAKLDLLLSSYLIYLYSDYDDLEESYIRDHFDTLEIIINSFYQDLIDSKFVSSDHKDILAKYNEILNKYYDLTFRDEYYCDTMFNHFLNISYAYLICNNKICYDYKEIMNFLDRVDENMIELNHKLIVSGLETEEDILNYIKEYYKPNKKINKKQIN